MPGGDPKPPLTPLACPPQELFDVILDENQLEDACEHLAEYLEVYWRATHHPPHAPHAVPSPTGLPGLQVPSRAPLPSPCGQPAQGYTVQGAAPPAPSPKSHPYPQSQQLLGERGEHSPLEHDSLMPSDEAGETSPQPWGAASQRSSRHLEEEEYADPYPDLYQPHRHHNSGLQGPGAPDRQTERNHDRNWQRSRPWAKDSY